MTLYSYITNYFKTPPKMVKRKVIGEDGEELEIEVDEQELK